jgi:hypothetical protein
MQYNHNKNHPNKNVSINLHYHKVEKYLILVNDDSEQIDKISHVLCVLILYRNTTNNVFVDYKHIGVQGRPKFYMHCGAST